MQRYICIHAHFYQPPRENPWLEAVELQSSAHPYHDWNQRISSECYAPNASARILGAENKISHIVNNYQKISFNFGPTLLSWLEKYEPETYQALRDSDRLGQKNFDGHGPALAQCYSHMIMPLANHRDKQTQVIWGLRDFEYRFGRKAEGMWLPETAVDLASLELLAEHGVRFTILAPNQCRRVREIGKRRWQDTTHSTVDPRVPYLCRLPSGKEIILFFYDGQISRDIAFGNLLNNGEHFAHRLLNALDPNGTPQLINIATDGETYGHHHKMGDMALAYALDHIERKELGQVMLYSQFLEKFPVLHEAEIVENSSWSCSHGIGRWSENCGCHTGGQPGWTQNWRAPLRAALNWLRDECVTIYEKKGASLLKDVWAARNDYIEVVLNRDIATVEEFLARHAFQPLEEKTKTKILKLLEMQRQTMQMYTSCGWFFSELSGIETVQILQYAARALQLAEDISGQKLESRFLQLLAQANSNIPEFKNGAQIYERFVRPAILNILDAAAHFAVSSLFVDYPQSAQLYCYTVRVQRFDRYEEGPCKLVLGKVLIRSTITWEEMVVDFAVMHLGDHNLLCGVDEFHDEKLYAKMHQDIVHTFKRNDSAATLRQIEGHFRNTHYSLRNLFKDEQRKVLYQILDKNLEDIEDSFRKINKHRVEVINVTKQLNMAIPKVLANTVSVMFDTDLLRALGQNPPDCPHLQELVSEIKEFGLEIDRETLSFIVRRKIEELMSLFAANPHDFDSLKIVDSLLRALKPLSLPLDLWKPQNIYYFSGKKIYTQMKQRARQGDHLAKEWVMTFHSLGGHLKIPPAIFEAQTSLVQN